ncbi:MAG: GntG family PLP-dependent aldolase [Bdellovibrionota bacterium]
MFKGIDFYSDTMTKPTVEMKNAMLNAEVGDEQKGEDPTTLALEEMVAQMFGFETALFLPSSTMCNQIALKLHTEPGDELLAADNCHLFFAEAGGPAVHSALMAKPIFTTNGIFSGEDVLKTYRKIRGPHYPVSKLVSIENTTNMGGGVAWELESIREVLNVSKELGLKTHLDGSRLFNAVVKTSTPVKEIVKDFDTVTLCLSKGLGCPMGALLAFPKKHFEKVRRLKQLFGGSMRQSGIVAAAGIYALQNNINRLAEDHANATLLARKIHEELPLLKIETTNPSTNMVFFSWTGQKMSPTQFNELCIANGIRFSPVGENRFRAVTHLNISKEDVERAVKLLKHVLLHDAPIAKYE